MDMIILMLGLALLAGLFLGYIIRWMIGESKYKGRMQKQVRRECERAAHNERERMYKVFNEISSLTASLNYTRVLNNALDLTASILSQTENQPDTLVSAVLLFSAPEAGNLAHLTVGSARRLTPSDARISIPGTSGLIGDAIDAGEATLSLDISSDPELCRIVGLRSCKSAYCIPLRLGLEMYGVLLFAHPNGDFFNPNRCETLKLVGSQAVIAIQNARLYQDLEQEKERMLEVQEETRKKLARDLHDGPTQSVAAIAMRVNFARRLLERDPKATADEMFKIEDLARRTTKEIRHMLFTLRPLVLESSGLVAALEAAAEKMKETYNQNVIIVADPTVVSELEMSRQAVIFYIAEEAMGNARKHAQAANIWIRIRKIDREMALLEIQDDGVGFNVGAVEGSYSTRGSLGMVNMRERAELVNGRLHIDSAEGKGTKIQVAIPLSEEAADRLRSGT